MSMQTPLTSYYEISYSVTGSGGEFPFRIALAVLDQDYTGTGSEFGAGVVSGAEQLKTIARGIAQAIKAKSAPTWDTIKVTAVDGATVGRSRLPVQPD